MPVPAANLINVEIIIQGQLATGGSNPKNVAIVHHFRRTAVLIGPNKTNIDAAFQTAIGAKYLLALNARFGQTQNTVRFLNDSMDAPVAFAHVGVGAIAGDPLSTMATAYMVLRTGFKGRSFRGSKHIAGFSESDVTLGDVWNAGALGRLGAIAAAILAGFTDTDGNQWVPQVYSRKLSEFVTLPAVVAYDVSQIQVNNASAV